MTSIMIALCLAAAPSRAADFKRDAQDWIQKSKELGRLDCRAIQDIWYAACSADLESEDPGPDLEQAKQAMDAAVGPVQSKAQALERDYKSKLEPWIKANKNPPSDVKPVLQELDKRLKRVKNLASGTMRGSNHPALQFAAKHGVGQHQELAGYHRCTVADISFGGRKRPDCVKTDACAIYEFKPDNPNARSLGATQLSGYKKQVEAHYAQALKTGANDAKFGGAKALAEVRNKCAKGGRVEFKTEIKTYKMCKFSAVCTE